MDTFFFKYKVLRGTCSVDLGIAASRLRGRRRMEAAKSKTGYISICSPANVRPDGNNRCTASCGACRICLMAQQVTYRPYMSL